MMSNDLVPLDLSQLPAVPEDQLQTTVPNYLQRIQLVGKGKYVDTGKIKPGRWGVPKGEEILDLGEEIDILPIAKRDKALDLSDRENIIAVYDKESDEYARIKAAPKNTGCMWGSSYLVLERKTGVLYELYFGNPSGRAEADKLIPFLPRKGQDAQVATMLIKYKTAKDYGWHVPVVTRCSEAIEGGPEMEAIVAEVTKFNNPQVGPEKVEDAKRAR
jgi:hypothetical protein